MLQHVGRRRVDAEHVARLVILGADGAEFRRDRRLEHGGIGRAAHGFERGVAAEERVRARPPDGDRLPVGLLDRVGHLRPERDGLARDGDDTVAGLDAGLRGGVPADHVPDERRPRVDAELAFGAVEPGGEVLGRRERDRLPTTLDGVGRTVGRERGDAAGRVEFAERLAVDGHETIACAEPDVGGEGTVGDVDGADVLGGDVRLAVPPLQPDEDGEGEDEVEDHPGRDDDDPLPDRLRAELPRLRLLLEVRPCPSISSIIPEILT